MTPSPSWPSTTPTCTSSAATPGPGEGLGPWGPSGLREERRAPQVQGSPQGERVASSQFWAFCSPKRRGNQLWVLEKGHRERRCLLLKQMAGSPCAQEAPAWGCGSQELRPRWESHTDHLSTSRHCVYVPLCWALRADERGVRRAPAMQPCTAQRREHKQRERHSEFMCPLGDLHRGSRVKDR